MQARQRNRGNTNVKIVTSYTVVIPPKRQQPVRKNRLYFSGLALIISQIMHSDVKILIAFRVLRIAEPTRVVFL